MKVLCHSHNLYAEYSQCLTKPLKAELDRLRTDWVTNNCLLISMLIVSACLAKDDADSNEVSPSRALLKVLTELENEDRELKSRETEDKIVEKAPASAFSIFANSNRVTTTVAPEDIKETKKSIFVQKSQGIQHSPITTVEKEELDPYKDAEQILTSASNSFSLTKQGQRPSAHSVSSTTKNPKYIRDYEIVPTTLTKAETTTISTSTEENEAKVEDVQFFSAPLVAAFTVHQDEQGISKKVESLLKPVFTEKQKDEIKLEGNVRLREDNLKQEHEKRKQEIAIQLDLQKKQKELENEIVRLQQQLNQQQKVQFRQQNLKLILRSMLNPAINQFTTNVPLLNPSTNQVNANSGTVNNERTSINQIISSPPISNVNMPVEPLQQFNNNSGKSKSSVLLLPSLTYDPLIVLGKLPINGQLLPIKGPVNFHTPFIQRSGFPQFHSVSFANPVNNFDQLQNVSPQFSTVNNHKHRFFRQEADVGNIVNIPSFSLQTSIQEPEQHSSF
ncbi:hypothetical protein NQ317_003892 [Molorchus minor]|uniref:Uncharacterized protein n=1 Tax=Molorchus minor TaxID=1323400 RepID=A0ABQ9IRW9_9CUCU|nr:hypothetical protein NQ317_003892 [Molorchus minor]